MIPPLYEHQKKIIADDFLWYGNWQGTGSAKTRSCLELAEGATLVICPKQQKLDRTWENNAEKFDIIINLTVMSKEEFRRDWKNLKRYDTVIIDECHNHLGVLPQTYQKDLVKYPKTSQIFEATKGYLKKHPPKRFYMASATPVSKPLNLFAIATLFGKDWDYFAFRDRYYIEIQRNIWIPRKSKELKQELADLTKTFGYTGTLFDFFDVPEQTHRVVHIELSKEQKDEIKRINDEDAIPLAKVGKIRTVENGILYEKVVENLKDGVGNLVKKVRYFESKKIDYIKERAIEFPKLLIFADYIAQVEMIAKELTKAGYKVFTLTGKTKKREDIVETAEALKECIVIAQAGVSAGYELPSINCVIFASKSNRFLNYEQGLGRVLRSNHLKKNLYIHLVVPGGSDESCHNTIMDGKDFQEQIQELPTVDSDSDIV